jgi:hypothetical protein
MKYEKKIKTVMVNNSTNNHLSPQNITQKETMTYGFIWPRGFRGEDFFKSANQKQ